MYRPWLLILCLQLQLLLSPHLDALSRPKLLRRRAHTSRLNRICQRCLLRAFKESDRFIQHAGCCGVLFLYIRTHSHTVADILAPFVWVWLAHHVKHNRMCLVSSLTSGPVFHELSLQL